MGPERQRGLNSEDRLRCAKSIPTFLSHRIEIAYLSCIHGQRGISCSRGKLGVHGIRQHLSSNGRLGSGVQSLYGNALAVVYGSDGLMGAKR